MITKNIIKFSGLLEKICPLLEEAGFEVTAIEEYAKRSSLTGAFERLTGEFSIRIIPKDEASPQRSL